MTSRVHFGHGPFYPTNPVYGKRAKKTIDSTEEFISDVKKTIEADPFFSNPVSTANRFLDYLETFLTHEGNPTLIIPEIRIGSSTLKNITCVELVYRIFMTDIEGLDVFWDNEGVAIYKRFNDVINNSLSKIDQLIENPDLSIEEMTALIQCVQATDPYLSKAKDTANRILTLAEQFLKKKGNPISSVFNVKMGDERLNKLTILEIIYLIWRHPYDSDFLDDWSNAGEDEGEDEGEGEDNINTRFETVISNYLQCINQMLRNDSLKDEDFLPLIRCMIEFSDDEGAMLNEENCRKYLHLMNYFVKRKVDPNLSFSKIQIAGNTYSHLTCFQITYLLWKNQNVTWSDLAEKKFEMIFDAMLSDRRIDLTLRFSERSLVVHHFVNSKNIEFYRQQHSKSKKEKFYTNGSYKPNADVIDQLHGHSLERITIAHYAAILDDYTLLQRFLDIEPGLIDMKCCMTQGKATIDAESHRILIARGKFQNIHILEENDQLSGNLAIDGHDKHSSVSVYRQVIRITNVTLLHLAARAGHESVLACLGGKHPNLAATDSDNKTPQDYLRFSVSEGVVVNDNKAKKMFKALDLTVNINKSAALPEVNKLIRHNGYDVLYNTSRKVAVFVRQRLRKNSFGEAERTNKWKENEVIPKLNRSTDKDYVKTGKHRGHLAEAEAATESDEKMAATFQLENAVPQDPNLNSGMWSRLEAHVRELTHQNDLVEVFTGPLFVPQGKVINHEVMGDGKVHVPTHLFKVIFKHNRITTKEIYILPNQANTQKLKFTAFRDDDRIDFIQQHSGILFNQWVQGL